GHDLYGLCRCEAGLDDQLVIALVAETRKRAAESRRIHARREGAARVDERLLERHLTLEHLRREHPLRRGIDIRPHAQIRRLYLWCHGLERALVAHGSVLEEWLEDGERRRHRHLLVDHLLDR